MTNSIMIDEENFKHLVRGGVIEFDGTRIALADIGYLKMIEAIDGAIEEAKKREKNYMNYIFPTNEFNIGDDVFIVCVDHISGILSSENICRKIAGMDAIDGINKYSIDGILGYFDAAALSKTRNEAIDRVIDQLELFKNV